MGNRASKLGLAAAALLATAGAVFWAHWFQSAVRAKGHTHESSIVVFEHGGPIARASSHRSRTRSQVVTPAPSPHPPTPRPPSVTPTPHLPRTVTVKQGDSLWDIAKRVYGDGPRYKDIARENHIPPPYVLSAGEKLRLPRR